MMMPGEGYLDPMKLPHGCAVAIVELQGCWPAAQVVPDNINRTYGDWSAGRWAWQLKKLERIQPPIPMRGKQGLWNLPDDWRQGHG
jgi:hypothetical protein